MCINNSYCFYFFKISVNLQGVVAIPLQSYVYGGINLNFIRLKDTFMKLVLILIIEDLYTLEVKAVRSLLREEAPHGVKEIVLHI